MSAIFGERLIFGQQNGPNIELIVYGDEFYARYENPDGYTVIYDLDRGLYCYARLQEGRFVSSGTPVNKPAPWGIDRHIKEAKQVRNEKFDEKYNIKRPKIAALSASSNVLRTLGPNSGLLEGRQLSLGDRKGLTILVEFDDLQTSISAADVDALLNGNNYKEHGNYCSVNEYYQLMSAGKLNYTNKVVGPVRLSRKQSYYINHLLISEALEIAVDQFNIDLSEFDSMNEGIVDAVSFMYAGRSVYTGDLWPHNFIEEIRFGNFKTHFYTIQSLGRSRIDLSIGTFAHESGHMLCRFPDLYDYGQRDGDFEESSGLAQYCLMASGNHNGGGKRPSPVCAYLRDLAGWCNNYINLNNHGDYGAKHGDYGSVMRFSTNKPNEYFIIENRNQQDLDQALPDKGLAIYHCDTMGSNEFQDGTPDNHYQCALMQADGHFDLENTVNGGDDGDLFESIQGIALSDSTQPHSRKWDGADSGLIISAIEASGAIIHFKTGSMISTDIVSASVVSDMIIPDNDPEGVSSKIVINQSGNLESIQLGVKISHTYRGDLKVKLISPSGKTIVLHDKEGSYQDNLILDLNTENFNGFSRLVGEAIDGEWILNVSDLQPEDSGRLDEWNISIKYKAEDEFSEGETSPGITIPDNDYKGITSKISIDDEGLVKGLLIDVDISHTFRGDILIDLIAPSGQKVNLRRSEGGSGDNIIETYTEESTVALKTLLGEQVKGEWALHVCDMAKYDLGILNRWAIKIRR